MVARAPRNGSTNNNAPAVKAASSIIARRRSSSLSERSDGRVVARAEDGRCCTCVAACEGAAVVGCEDGSARSSRLRLRGAMEAYLRGAEAGVASLRPRTFSAEPAAPVTAAVVVDDSLLVTAALDGKLRLWELGSGRLLRTNDAHSDAVYALHWDARSESVLSAGGDQSVRAWKVRSGVSSSSLVHVFSDPLSAVAAASELRAGLVFVGTNNGRVCGADVSKSGGASYFLRGHTGRVTALAACGSTLFSASRDGTARAWELPHPDDSTDESFFVEPAAVLSHGDDAPPVESLVALHGGRVLLTGAADGVVRRFEGPGWAVLTRTYTGHAGPVLGLAVDAGAGALVSTGADLTLRQWDALEECEFCARRCPRGDCLVRVVRCSLPGCPVEVQRRLLAAHEKACPSRPGACPHAGCGQRVAAGDLDAHRSECAFRSQPCPHKGCTEQVVARALPEHVAACCWRRERCPADGCRVTLPFIELQAHTPTCAHQVVDCPNEGCGKRLPLHAVDAHCAECKFRRVPCEYAGCEEMLSGKDILTHPFLCRFQPVECPNGCDEPLVLHLVTAHRRDTCALGQVPCPVGCGAELLRKDVGAHSCGPAAPAAPAAPAPAPKKRPAPMRRRASTGNVVRAPTPKAPKAKVKRFVAFGTTARRRRVVAPGPVVAAGGAGVAGGAGGAGAADAVPIAAPPSENGTELPAAPAATAPPPAEPETPEEEPEPPRRKVPLRRRPQLRRRASVR